MEKVRTTCKKPPLVSVVIPCYNAEKTLAAAVDSALAQAKDVPLEIILIDDGCTDGTAKVMRSYLRDKIQAHAPDLQNEDQEKETGTRAGVQTCSDEKEPALERELSCIRIIRHEKSRGAAAGRNAGVAAALGTYVAFLDADDIWAEGKLKAQVEVMQRHDKETDFHLPPLCCTARELMTPEGVLTGRVIPVKEKIGYRELLKHNSINCSSVLIRADIAREFPMEHEDSHEDYITWLKVLKKYGPAAGINKPYLKYRLSSSGKSGSKVKSAKMTYTAYRYAGLSPARAAGCFVSYALHGMWKYWRA